MDKLELKHVAHYFPYDLNCFAFNGFSTKKGKIVSVAKNGVLLELSKKQGIIYLFSEIKPILRPMSSLTNDSLRAEMYKRDHPSHIDWTTDERESIIKDHGFEYWLKDIPYIITQYLFENHYDVFSLIDKGLAVDMNTLKQQA